MNAKNSFGGYTGFKKFHFLMEALSAIEDQGILADMFPKSHAEFCGEKLVDINFSMGNNSSDGDDLASQLERLSKIKKDGLLTDAEFDAAKKKLLN